MKLIISQLNCFSASIFMKNNDEEATGDLRFKTQSCRSLFHSYKTSCYLSTQTETKTITGTNKTATQNMYHISCY